MKKFTVITAAVSLWFLVLYVVVSFVMQPAKATTSTPGGVVAEFKGGVPLQPAMTVEQVQPAIGQ